MVLIHSFLRTNPWFDGDIVIILNKVQFQKEELDLLKTFNNVYLIQVSKELASSIQNVVSLNPGIGSREAQFYSLDSFGLSAYDKVLFCDSDLLFLDCVQELFMKDEALICSGDGPYYQGLVRDRVSFKTLVTKDPVNELSNTFNAGFMLIERSLLSKDTVKGLLDLMNREQWYCDNTAHTDQLILNQYFAGKQHLVGPIYNYLIAHRNTIGSHLQDRSAVKVCHFNGPDKPWLINQVLLAAGQNKLSYDFYRQWNQSYAQLLGLLSIKELHNM
jgi:lipopolysaccharide biosynthesis glycosyltransferase